MTSKIKKYVALSGIALLLGLTLFTGAPAIGEDTMPATEGALFKKIRHMEAMLFRPCEKVEGLMKDLIRNGRAYQVTELTRALIFAQWSQAFEKSVGDFIVPADNDSSIPPGKFAKRFYYLKATAKQAGILAEGPRPARGLTVLVHSRDRDKYFYFEESGSTAAGEKLALRIKLLEDFKKLQEDWNKAREEFYKQFEGKGILSGYADDLKNKTKEGENQATLYTARKAELITDAQSGNFEHCLGKKRLMAYSLPGDSLAPPYQQGPEDSVESFPGMGFKIEAQKQYKAIKKPDVGNFPLALYLKFNGNDTLEYERNLLIIKNQAEEEETKILGFGLGKFGRFAFESIYKVDAALAAPAHLVFYVGSHPIDSMGKAADFVKSIPQVVIDIGNKDVFSTINRPSDFFWDKTGNLIDAAKEIAKDIKDSDRFEPRPGETLQEEITRLENKLEATKKVKEGIEVASDITAIAVQLLLDKGLMKGLGLKDDLIKSAAQDTKAAALVKKVAFLEEQAKAVKAADGIPRELLQGTKTVKELADEQQRSCGRRS